MPANDDDLRSALQALAAASSGKLTFRVLDTKQLGASIGVELGRSTNPVYEFVVSEADGSRFRSVAYTLALDASSRPATRAEALGRGLSQDGGRLFNENPFLLVYDYRGRRFMAISAVKLFGAFAKAIAAEPIAASETASFSLSPNFTHKTISMYATVREPDIWYTNVNQAEPSLSRLLQALTQIHNETKAAAPEIQSIVLAVQNRIRATTQGTIAAATLEAETPFSSVSIEHVTKAFEETTEADWKDKPGVEPYWLVRIGTEEKPLKAVFRKLPVVGEGTAFTTQTAARVLRQLGFDVLNSRQTTAAFPSRRYWIWAPGRNADQWTESRSKGEMGIGWSELGDLARFQSIDEIAGAIKQVYDKDTEPINDARTTWDFSHEISKGDVIFAKTGQTTVLGAGVVIGPYVRNEERTSGFKNLRTVEWLRIGDWELQAGERFPIKTLTEITKWPDFIEKLTNLVGGLPGVSAMTISKPAEEAARLAPKCDLDDLVLESGFERTVLERWIRQLQRKKHLVFQGPPGTGKTFLAKGLARTLVSETAGHFEVVQFHPSYAYEDFIQGIRPSTSDAGDLRYDIEQGRFLRFCARATKIGSAPAVLIIDEMNRANLSRVFGELMYLLEYREDHVPLSGGGQFSVPSNVFVIGTMNTADRSIALVDHALRRRFTFVHLGPEYEVLRRHLERNALPANSLVRTLKVVNEAIRDPNYMVGISFFMKDGASLRSTLPDVWHGEIEPYLEEYFFDQPERVAPLRLEALYQGELKDWA